MFLLFPCATWIKWWGGRGRKDEDDDELKESDQKITGTGIKNDVKVEIVKPNTDNTKQIGEENFGVKLEEDEVVEIVDLIEAEAKKEETVEEENVEAKKETVEAENIEEEN